MNWSAFLTLGVLAASIHWTVARAKITQWFWGASWLPRILNELLSCPACSGFWIGLGLGLAGLRPLHTDLVTLDVLATGVLALYTTPILEGVMLWGLERSRIP